jgi:hypothetical protein
MPAQAGIQNGLIERHSRFRAHDATATSVIWDDRCTLLEVHADLAANDRRLMHRIVLADIA